MTSTRSFITAIFALVFLLGACVKGRGPIITDILQVDPFTGIELALNADVYLQQGTQQEVIVEGQENIIDLINLRVENGVWKIDFNEPVRKYKRLTFYIVMPAVRLLSVTGDGNISTENTMLDVDDLTLKVTGTGNITANVEANTSRTEITGAGNVLLNGETGSYTITISGTGNAGSFDFVATDCDVTITGSGNVELTALSTLDVTITGSGNVTYKGNPVINANITGSGQIINGN